LDIRIEKITVEIKNDDIELLKDELKNIEILITYTNTINYKQYLEKIAAELKNFLRNSGLL
jgi:hypothetical protein